ncbi:MAG: hypothetical protein ACQKBT_09050, partial [Puniceicoccales bacterium]
EREGVIEQLKLEALRLQNEAAGSFIYFAEIAAESHEAETVLGGPLRDSVGELESFGPETWENRVENPWELKISPSERVSVAYESEGAKSPLRIERAYAAGISYEFEVNSGREAGERYFYEGAVDLSARISAGNRTSIEFRWWDAMGKSLGRSRAIRLPQGAEVLEDRVWVLGYPPEHAVRGTLEIAAVRQEEGDWLSISSIQIDRFPIPSSGLVE